jgi:hypothetical protein
MRFTIEQYEKLKEAIVNGVYSVTYGNKTVTYRTIADMLKALELMESELFPDRNPRRRLASVDRGYFKR